MGVAVEVNTEVTENLIKEKKPDVVVLATGSTEVIPDIPGIKGPNVITLDDYLSKRKKVGKRVAILGGHYGAEVAISLGREGKKMPDPGYNKYHLPFEKRILQVDDPNKVKEVSILEQGPMVGWPPFSHISRFVVINEFLAEAGVKCLTQVNVKEITDGAVKYLSSDGKEESISVDTVIVATGRAPNRVLYKKLSGKGISLWEIGDCAGPEKVEKAIHTANYTARQI